MTSVEFLFNGKDICGFKVEGHSSKNCRDKEGKLVCAAVSSAVYMTVNTVTDVIGDKAKVTESDAFMYLEVQNPSDKTVVLLEGFLKHITELSKMYSNNLRIHSEV